MRYTIGSVRSSSARSDEADSESAALDIVDYLVASGFAVGSVFDNQTRTTITASDLLDRLLAGGDLGGVEITPSA